MEISIISISWFHHCQGSKIYLIWRTVLIRGYSTLPSRNRSALRFQMMNGGMILAQQCSLVLKNPTAMWEVQCNSAGFSFNSWEIILAKAPKMMVSDESMNQGTSSLEIFSEKSRWRKWESFLSRSRSEFLVNVFCFSVMINYMYQLLMNLVN